MKKIVYAVFGLILIVVLAAGGALFFVDRIIEKAVNEAGSSVLHVETRLDRCNLSFMNGTLSLKGFLLGNPKGFKSERMIYLGDIFVALDTGSILEDTIRVKEVLIKGADVTYEVAGIGKTNLGSFLDGLKGTSSKKAAKKSEKEGKKVVIDRLVFEDGAVTLATTLTGGEGVRTPLPRIEMKDLGKDKDMSLQETLEEVFSELGRVSYKTAGRSKEFLKELGGKLGSTTDTLKKKTGGVTDKLKGLFR
jgi:hypothetical protein